MRPPRRLHALALTAAIALTTTGCTTASPAPDAYRARTELAVSDAISHVGTARKVLSAAEAGRVPAAYALATVRQSDDILATVVDSYEELYPPESLDGLHARATSLLGDATDLVGESRIALYRSDERDYADLVTQLDGLTRRLERLDEALS